MPPNLDGLVSTEYARNLLSSNMRLITEMQTHLWRIQELAVSMSDPHKQCNAVSTLNSSAGTKTVHRGVGRRGPLSVAFSSTFDDRGSSYISEISIVDNESGWHERGDIVKDIPSSGLRLLPSHGRHSKSTPTSTIESSSLLQSPDSRPSIPRPHWSQSVGTQPFSDEVIMGDIDTYFNDVDEFYLLVAASEAARAKRRQNVVRLSKSLLDNTDDEMGNLQGGRKAARRTLSIRRIESRLDTFNESGTASNLQWDPTAEIRADGLPDSETDAISKGPHIRLNSLTISTSIELKTSNRPRKRAMGKKAKKNVTCVV